MQGSSTDPWWSFTLDPDERSDPEAARLRAPDGAPVVNPPDKGGRGRLDYPSYLRLDRLLDAQVPSSSVPEERVFIILHQLFELVFKQMIFDLAVVGRTFEAMLAQDAGSLRALALEPLPDEAGPSAFWRPAMTAAARLRHSARRVLPMVMGYVGHGEDDDVLFSSLEYRCFREFLAPASGFQTAQLRLIQRALGKEQLLRLRVFPGEVYRRHYGGGPGGHLALGDPLLLREGRETAFPPADHPAEVVTRVDDLAHALLARLADGTPAPPRLPPIRRIHPEEVERAVSRLQATLGDRADTGPIIADFRADLAAAAGEENTRRERFEPARRGAHRLQAHHAPTCIAFVLDRLVATDAALHSPSPDSFLSVHRKAVRRHVGPESGTGGGGMPYLVTSQRFLLPLFPALVAYSDLGLGTTADERDRW